MGKMEISVSKLYKDIISVRPYAWLTTADPTNTMDEIATVYDRKGFLVLSYSPGGGIVPMGKDGEGMGISVASALPEPIKEKWTRFAIEGVTPPEAISYITGFRTERLISLEDDIDIGSLCDDLAIIAEHMMREADSRASRIDDKNNTMHVVILMEGIEDSINNDSLGFMRSALRYGFNRIKKYRASVENRIINLPVTILAVSKNDLPEQLSDYFEPYTLALPSEEELRTTLTRAIQSYAAGVAKRNPAIAMTVTENAKKLINDRNFIQETVSSAAGMRMTDFIIALKKAFREVGAQKLFTEPTKENKEHFTKVIWEEKLKYISGINGLELYKPTEKDSFEYLGGLDRIKDFLRSTVGSPNARGVLLTGVPGTGKSAIAKATAKELGVPVIKLNLQNVYHGVVGATEANMNRLLQTVDRMAPCVLFIDELEKQLAGYRSSHMTDGGVTTRLMGTLLEWMNDRTSNVYIIGTTNDISLLPDEFKRAGRWDAIFYFDFPTKEEREQIWEIWRKHYNIPDEAKLPDDEKWTGAEIHHCCRLARLFLDRNTASPEECLIKAAENIIPLKDQIDPNSYREKAKFAVPASSKYDTARTRAKKTRRRTKPVEANPVDPEADAFTEWSPL